MQTIGPVTAPMPSIPEDNALRQAAMQLEAGFLAEMLKSAGLGTTPEGFGGGAGEDQCASFLVAEQAMAMVQAGGIGLSESIYEAPKERENDGEH